MLRQVNQEDFWDFFGFWKDNEGKEMLRQAEQEDFWYFTLHAISTTIWSTPRMYPRSSAG